MNTDHDDTAPDRMACPSCGCQHLPVAYTRHRGRFIVRARDCRHCGRRITTREKITGTPDEAEA